MTGTSANVAIIGAGLAGTALALALHQLGISTQIYEARAQDAPEIASGVVLTPNGLRVLDALGVFARIRDRCWKAEYRTYKNDRDETTRKIFVADEKLYGYKNHRIWRRLLLAEMKLMLEDRGVPIHFQSRFSCIVTESEGAVRFLINGCEVESSLLIGADGIFSSVRRQLYPNIQPEYTGTIGAMAHVQSDLVNWPHPEYERQFTMQGKAGVFITMPEDPMAKDIMVTVQHSRPESTKAEWDALNADKNRLCDEFFMKNYDKWHDTAKSIMNQVCVAKDSIFLWPFLRMPVLERWYSKSGNVVLIGDAAHAVPPSSGQGVSQALEDVYSLALVLARSRDVRGDLQTWQSMRQQRIEAVVDWTMNSSNVNRMPERDRDKLIEEGKIRDPKWGDDMRWLYWLDLDEEMKWLADGKDTSV